MKDYLNVDIDPEHEKSIFAIINQLWGKMEYFINLTKSETTNNIMLGDKLKPFVEKAVYYAESNKEYMPGYLEMKPFKKDFKLFNFLSSVENNVTKLLEAIVDTRRAAGSTSLKTANEIYRIHQGMAKSNVPGSDAAVLDMREHYLKNKRKKRTDETDEKDFPDNQPKDKKD